MIVENVESEFAFLYNTPMRKYVELIIGSILLSLGIYLFVTPNGINFGGVIGLAQIIEYFLVKCMPNFSKMNLVGVINFLINIPLFIMGFKIMNKEFCIKTIISLIVQTLTLSILPKQSIVIMPDMLSNCIFGALMCGVGVGLALQSSGCCGGMDIAGVCLSKIKPGFSVGKLSNIVNSILFAICAFLFDVQTSLYSILFVVILYFVSDRIHYQNINVTVFVFTRKENMKNVIMEKTGRGVTYWMGKGAYTENDEYILYCAINKYEIRNFKKIVHDIDPNVFITISEGQEINGGFEKRL